MSADDRQPAPPRHINEINRDLIAEFRATRGRVSGQFSSVPILLLTHTGAKSGQRRTTPLAYTVDGDRLVVIASKAGGPADPHWFLNITADPRVTVELPGETFEAVARVVEGEERDRLYRAQADVIPSFDTYQERTRRRIPVVVLERR